MIYMKCDFEVVNIVCKIHFGQRIDLDRLAECKSGLYDIYYNPEEFPGVRCKIIDDASRRKISFSVFRSGAVQIAGLKSIEEGKEITHKIRDFVKSYLYIEQPEEIMAGGIL